MTEIVKRALEQMRKKIDAGDSFLIARRKIIGTPTQKLAKEVMKTEEYVQMLNEHMEKSGYSTKFKLCDNRIVQIRNRDGIV